jgi:hypothetical protein
VLSTAPAVGGGARERVASESTVLHVDVRRASYLRAQAQHRLTTSEPGSVRLDMPSHSTLATPTSASTLSFQFDKVCDVGVDAVERLMCDV